VQEDCHCRGHGEEVTDCAVTSARDDQEIGPRRCRGLERLGIGKRHNRILGAVDQQHRDAQARDRGDRGEVRETLANSALDLIEHEPHGDSRHSATAHCPAHIGGRIRHRRDADDRCNSRVSCGHHQACPGADRMAHNSDAVRVDAWVGA
jgi:hypothetical protein